MELDKFVCINQSSFYIDQYLLQTEIENILLFKKFFCSFIENDCFYLYLVVYSFYRCLRDFYNEKTDDFKNLQFSCNNMIKSKTHL